MPCRGLKPRDRTFFLSSPCQRRTLILLCLYDIAIAGTDKIKLEDEEGLGLGSAIAEVAGRITGVKDEIKKRYRLSDSLFDENDSLKIENTKTSFAPKETFMFPTPIHVFALRGNIHSPFPPAA